MRKYLSVIFFSLLLTFLSAFAISVKAQDNLAGTYGTEFWLAFLRNNDVNADNDYLNLSVYAVAEEKVDIIVSLGNGNQLGTIAIPAGGGFGMLDKIAPATVYPSADDAKGGVYNKGIRIYAKDGKTKFSCYALSEVNGLGELAAGTTRDATLLLPKDVLGKEYFIQCYPEDTKSTEFAVVATEDQTSVTVVPNGVTKRGKADEPATVTLNKGQVYWVQSGTTTQPTESADLSGSTVCADKPIAVFNGNEATKIPNQGAYSVNHTFEQNIPQNMWGTQFYFGQAGGTKYNNVRATASFDNTNVTVKLAGNADKSITLNRGESFDLTDIIELIEDDNSTDVVLIADHPILCYSYLTCGAENKVGTGSNAKTWGNPANAMVVPWSHRTQAMSFYTDTIANQKAGAERKYFVQIVTAKSDISKIIIDGTTVPSSSFKTFSGDANMAYANYELTTRGKHHITSVGQGFTGFVHGITAEARAYQYTLGFDPPKYLDSLFIENPEEVMSHRSYDYANLPYMPNQGWYQRQPIDFPIEEQRIDTAYVCDSTIINFFGQLAVQNSSDVVIWKIYECDEKGEKIEPAIKSFNSTPDPNDPTHHKLAYQFTVNTKKDTPNKRVPFTYYSVDMEKYKKHLICTDLPDDADTLRTMIRVNREYNDTTWRIVCETDTLHFFKEVPAAQWVKTITGKGGNKDTVFQFNKEDASKGIVKYTKGDNTYSRWYKSINGCDSIVTLKLFGCDTLYHYLDTTVCENNFQHLKDSLNQKLNRFKSTTFNIKTQAQLKQLAADGNLAPYTETYKDARKSKSCLDVDDPYSPEGKIIAEYKQHCKDFTGCPDTFELKLTIVPLLYWPERIPTETYWCVGDNPNAPDWTRSDGSLVTDNLGNPVVIRETDEEFGGGNVGTYIDTVWYNCPDCPGGKCPIERDIIIVHIARDEEDTIHICQTEQHYHKYGGGSNTYYYGWDYTTPDKLYPNEAHNEVREINPPIAGATCQYKHRFVLYVHKTYVDDAAKNLQSEIKFYDTICIANTAKEYYPVNAAERWEVKSDSVWSVYENKKIHRDSIHYNLASIKNNANKSFEYIEQLKTLTCTDCENGVGCDSIRRFFLYVADTFHVVDPYELCDNAELDYIYDKQHYYFYSERYEGNKKSPYEIIYDADLNLICGEQKYFTKDFKGLTQFGCDSTRTLKVHLKATYTTEIDTFVCVSEGKYRFVDGKDYVLELGRNPLDTMVLSTILQPCGCDSGVIHNVYIRPSYNNSDNPDTDTICQWLTDADPKYYTWQDHPLDGQPPRKIFMQSITSNKGDSVWSNQIPTDTLAGTYRLIDALQTKTCPDCKNSGCDSTRVLLLTIIPTYDNIYRDTLSDQDILAWDGVLFAGPKAVIPPDNTLPVQYPVQGVCEKTNHYFTTVDTLKHSVGTHQCDSFMTYRIVFGETYYFPEYDFVCENCSYTWRDHTNADGTKTPIIISDVPKAGETKWYYDEYKTVLGFDSVFAIQLTGFPTKFNSEPGEVCQGTPFTWNGHPGQP
ncbi:MAG: IgGFc-binding protein, partial [Paludibacteraceae bacterium]|nr:IgGFc-binding protein [Paludibacteraceae bacterium]